MPITEYTNAFQYYQYIQSGIDFIEQVCGLSNLLWNIAIASYVLFVTIPFAVHAKGYNIQHNNFQVTRVSYHAGLQANQPQHITSYIINFCIMHACRLQANDIAILQFSCLHCSSQLTSMGQLASHVRSQLKTLLTTFCYIVNSYIAIAIIPL